MKRNRLEQLQFLRFMAFGLVFTRHSEEWIHFPTPGGNSVNAITFFFMLSGFVAAYSMFGREPDFSGTEIAEFMKRKIIKVYPLYIVTTLLSVLTSGFVGHILKHDTVVVKSMLFQLVKNTFLVQSWFSDGYFMFNGVAWYLSTLMFLYLITIPLLCLFRKVREYDEKKARIILISVIVISFFLITIYSIIMSGSNGNEEFWLYIFPPARICEYIAGIAMGYMLCIYKDSYGNFDANQSGTAVFTIMEIISLLFWIGIMVIPVTGWRYRIVEWFIPNVLLILVFSFGNGKISSILKNRFLVSLGDVTFECFLIHTLIIGAIDYIQGVLGNKETYIPDILCLIMALVFTVMISQLIKSGLSKDRSLG